MQTLLRIRALSCSLVLSRVRNFLKKKIPINHIGTFQFSNDAHSFHILTEDAMWIFFSPRLICKDVTELVIIWNLFSQLHQYHADNPLETECFFFSSKLLHASNALRWKTLRQNDKQWRMMTTPVIESYTRTFLSIHRFFSLSSTRIFFCFVLDNKKFYRRVDCRKKTTIDRLATNY